MGGSKAYSEQQDRVGPDDDHAGRGASPGLWAAHRRLPIVMVTSTVIPKGIAQGRFTPRRALPAAEPAHAGRVDAARGPESPE